LGILDQFDLAAQGPSSAQTVHWVSEAYRLVYSDRARYMADADFVAVPTNGLLDRDYLNSRAKLINTERAAPIFPSGKPAGVSAQAGDDESANLPATSHLSIVDQFGNAVAMTTSIESAFGSHLMVRGFLLNNHLTDFSRVARSASGAPIANRIEPGKRPRSAMAPTMVFNSNSDLEMIIGSPGGPNIIQYVVKTLIGVIDFKQDIQTAISAPNFGSVTPDSIVIERGSALEALSPALGAKSHQVKVLDLNSGLHGIAFNGVRNGVPGRFAHAPYSTWAGGADPRREGIAAGK
jgi:gamma-glutamyltranspeptidase/glutathione hydrolase